MKIRTAIATLALAAAAALPAHAGTTILNGDGIWTPFAVDSFLAPAGDSLSWIDDAGAALDFSFTIASGFTGTLTVVDAVIAGDTFVVRNHGSTIGTTSAVPVGTYEGSTNVGYDYDAALADPLHFSRAVFSFAEGSYLISGSLLQSVTMDGVPLDATGGALRLAVSPVPEGSNLAMVLAGFGLVAGLIRRRNGTSR